MIARPLGIGRPLSVLALCVLLGGAAPAFAATPVTVTGAQIGTADQVTVVALQFQGGEGAPTVSPFRQAGPERLVVDIAGATLAAGGLAPSGGIVSRSEFSTFNDGADNVRLTLYLSSQATWDIKAEGNTIVLTLKAGAVADPLGAALGQAPAPTGEDLRLSGPLSPVTGAALTSLDFQQKERVSRVLIGAQSSTPAVTQPERNLIAVDLPGATIPDSLRRELNTTFFYSAVESVRAYPTRAGARIAIRLREGAEYAIKQEGGLSVVEITIPADQVARRDEALGRAATAAPATPETNGTGGLSNASGSEVLIGGNGQTLNPQAQYGTGGGNRSGGFAFAEDVTNAYGADVHFTGRRMSIDLQEADIHTVFRFIADFGGINIVTSDDVKGTVTVRLKDVPWDEALASVLQAKGLAAQRMGDIIRVAPIETIKAEHNAALESKKSQDQLEQLQLYVAPLNYAAADDVKAQIASVLSERGKVETDARGNQLIIRDRSDVVAQVRELIRKLDHPNQQVSIEARFVEANSNFTSSMGIQWGGNMDASATTGYPTGAFFPSSVGISGGIPNGVAPVGDPMYTPNSESLLVDLGATGEKAALDFALGSIPGLIDVNARLSAIVSEGQGKIVSSPRVTALDNEEAVVTQGARIPYLSSSQNGTTVQFVAANLELKVTPHVTSDKTIFLTINVTNDRPDFSLGAAAQGQPGISTKQVTTKVLVPDGDTTVLGGVYATSETSSTSRVPGLGSIPVIGYLFKSSDKNKTQNEMLVFITPRIVPVETHPGGGS